MLRAVEVYIHFTFISTLISNGARFSGNTGAFSLPILQLLLGNPQRYFALILIPTRESACQMGEQFEALGSSINGCSRIIQMTLKNFSGKILEKTYRPIALNG